MIFGLSKWQEWGIIIFLFPWKLHFSVCSPDSLTDQILKNFEVKARVIKCVIFTSHYVIQTCFKITKLCPTALFRLQALGIIFLYQGNILQLLFLDRCLILRGTDSPFSMSGYESKSCPGGSFNLSLTWPIFHFLGWTCKFLIVTSRTEGLYLSRTWLQLVLCFVSSNKELFPFSLWVILFACWDTFS